MKLEIKKIVTTEEWKFQLYVNEFAYGLYSSNEAALAAGAPTAGVPAPGVAPTISGPGAAPLPDANLALAQPNIGGAVQTGATTPKPGSVPGAKEIAGVTEPPPDSQLFADPQGLFSDQLTGGPSVSSATKAKIALQAASAANQQQQPKQQQQQAPSRGATRRPPATLQPPAKVRRPIQRQLSTTAFRPTTTRKRPSLTELLQALGG